MDSSKQTLLWVIAGTAGNLPGGVSAISAAGIFGAGNFTKSVLLPVLKKQAHVQLKGICTATGMNAAQTGRWGAYPPDW